MKKAFLFLFAALVAAPYATAQNDIPDDIGVRFGIKLAPSMAWLRSDTKGLENDGSKIGFTFGLVMEFPIGAAGNYRFGTGLFLNNISAKYNIDAPYQDAINGPILTKTLNTDVKMGYIELPLTFKLMTNEIGYMRYFGQIGFGTAFNIRAKADFEEARFDTTGVYVTGFQLLEDEDYKDHIQPFRASLIVGAGMEYNFSGRTTLQAGLTYNKGFTNILKKVTVGDKKAKALQNYVELNLAIFF